MLKKLLTLKMLKCILILLNMFDYFCIVKNNCAIKIGGSLWEKIFLSGWKIWMIMIIPL